MNASSTAAAVAVQSPPRAHYEGLTALRGIAALMVVLVHVWGIHQLTLPALLQPVIPHFTLGVPLFFVISAFSLYASTTPRIDRPGWLNDYMTRRFMRIAPLFYSVALYQALIFPWITGTGTPGAKFLLTITFLYNFMPGYHESLVWAGWAVGVEMIFYLVLPVLLVTIRSLRSACILGIFFFIISGAFIDYYRKGEFPADYEWYSFFSALGVFGAGIIGFFLFQALRHRPSARPAGLVLLGVAGVLGTMIAVWWPDLIHLPFTLALLSAWPFMFLVVSQCLRPVWLITNRFFTHMGDLSFSLYLLHPPLVYFAEPIYGWLYDKAGGPGAGYVLSVLLTLVLLYPLARIAYRMIERPGIAWGERMIERRQQARRRLDAGCAPMPAE